MDIDEAVERAIRFRHHVRYAMAVFRDTNDRDRLIARLAALDEAEGRREALPESINSTAQMVLGRWHYDELHDDGTWHRVSPLWFWGLDNFADVSPQTRHAAEKQSAEMQGHSFAAFGKRTAK